jgi:SAM-dependent methyltransferase
MTNKRISDIIELLEESPYQSLNSFLDVGFGNGEIAEWLSQKGKAVTGIGLNLHSYLADLDKLNQKGIKTIECSIEQTPFADQSFDCIVMSHILEHCLNIGLVFDELKRILKSNGWLFIFLPPSENRVCAGHVATGWNIGQLMYVLLLNGFDVKQGKFIKYGYNICGFVQKNKKPLPLLRGDKGDINILQTNGFWPSAVMTKDRSNDSFFAEIKAINWETTSPVLQNINNLHTKKTRLLMTILEGFAKLFPEKVRIALGNFFIKSGKLIKKEIDDNSNDLINPKILKG